MKQFKEILNKVNVPCKDNGDSFLVRDKLNAVAQLLKNTSYGLQYEGKLCHIYSPRKQTDLPIVLISVHVDDVYDVYFFQDEAPDQWRGTFDNCLSAACVLNEMLDGGFAPNVWVAFTGDEENQGKGAVEVCDFLKHKDINAAQVVVTEVAHEGWEDCCPFVLENDQNMTFYQASQVFNVLMSYRFAYLHIAEPDESDVYGRAGLSVLTLSIPVDGDMHSNEGCCVRYALLPTYCEVLNGLVNLFAEMGED